MTTAQAADDPPVDLEGFRLVKAANEALDRIDAAGDDWLIIGEAYQHGRRRAMAQAHTNVPTGKRYNAAFEAWCQRTHFSLGRVDKYERRDLARILENRPAFDAWRATLTANQHHTWNHPSVMWRRFTATQAKGGTGPTLGQKARPNVIELGTENEMLKGKLAKAREGQLLIDLNHDSNDAMTNAVLHQPAVIENPRRFAELFRRIAFKLQQQANKSSEGTPKGTTTKPRRKAKHNEYTEATP